MQDLTEQALPLELRAELRAAYPDDARIARVLDKLTRLEDEAAVATEVMLSLRRQLRELHVAFADEMLRHLEVLMDLMPPELRPPDADAPEALSHVRVVARADTAERVSET